MRKIVASPYFFPALYLAWGIGYILFGEKLPVNEGLGWDGYKYADMATHLTGSAAVDSYRAMRIFPSALVHAIFSVGSITFTPANLVLAFEILNLCCVVIGLFFLKKIFAHFNFSFYAQVLGFILVICNHALLKFLFYYPVLTDAAAFCLGVLVLYSWIKGQELNLLLLAVIGAFTQPLLFYQALVLFAFPARPEAVSAVTKIPRLVLSSLSLLFIGACIYYYIFSKDLVAEMDYTLKLDRDLLWFSIAGLLLVYSFFPHLLSSGNFFQVSYWRGRLHLNRILFAFFLLLCVVLVSHRINFRNISGEEFSAATILQSNTLQGLTEPLITPAAHTFFFGLCIAFVIVFWKSFCEEAARYGPGMVFSFLLMLYLFGSINESRRFFCMFPWLVVFAVKVLDRRRIPGFVPVAAAMLGIVMSRVWLEIGYDLSCGVDASGVPDFPNQKFFMNLGPWMSKEMWMIQFWSLMACLLLVFLCFFKFDPASRRFIARSS